MPTGPGRGARAAESARLESVCGATHRGFESHSLRSPPTQPVGEPPQDDDLRQRVDGSTNRRALKDGDVADEDGAARRPDGPSAVRRAEHSPCSLRGGQVPLGRVRRRGRRRGDGGGARGGRAGRRGRRGPDRRRRADRRSRWWPAPATGGSATATPPRTPRCSPSGRPPPSGAPGGSTAPRWSSPSSRARCAPAPSLAARVGPGGVRRRQHRQRGVRDALQPLRRPPPQPRGGGRPRRAGRGRPPRCSIASSPTGARRSP